MKRSLLALPIVLAGACSGPTEPSGPYGFYRLQSIDGHPLPYVEETMRILSTSGLELIDKGPGYFFTAPDFYTVTWDTEFVDPTTGALVGRHQFANSGRVSIEGSTLDLDGTTGTLRARQIDVVGFWPLGNAARTPSERQLVFKR